MAKLINKLILLMKHAEIENLDSIGKKLYVLNSLKELFKIDEPTEEILNEIIDVIIAIDKHKIYIRKKNKWCLFCL